MHEFENPLVLLAFLDFSNYSHSMGSFGLRGYVVVAGILTFDIWCYYTSYFLLLMLCWSKVGRGLRTYDANFALLSDDHFVVSLLL